MDEEIKLLRAKMENYEKEKYKIKFCIHCKNDYNPLSNEQVSYPLLKFLFTYSYKIFCRIVANSILENWSFILVVVVEVMNITIVAIHAQNATLVAKKGNIFLLNNFK